MPLFLPCTFPKFNSNSDDRFPHEYLSPAWSNIQAATEQGKRNRQSCFAKRDRGIATIAGFRKLSLSSPSSIPLLLYLFAPVKPLDKLALTTPLEFTMLFSFLYSLRLTLDPLVSRLTREVPFISTRFEIILCHLLNFFESFSVCSVPLFPNDCLTNDHLPFSLFSLSPRFDFDASSTCSKLLSSAV